jgi:hypothetical protein
MCDSNGSLVSVFKSKTKERFHMITIFLLNIFKEKATNVITMMKSRGIRWAGHVERMWAKRNAYRILVGKPEGRRP